MSFALPISISIAIPKAIYRYLYIYLAIDIAISIYIYIYIYSSIASSIAIYISTSLLLPVCPSLQPFLCARHYSDFLAFMCDFLATSSDAVTAAIPVCPSCDSEFA